MTKTGSILLFVTAAVFAVAPQFAQTPAKPSFDVISIKPTAPGQRGGGGGVRGDKYTMTAITLRTLLQTAFQRPSTGGPIAQLQIIGAPPWMDLSLIHISEPTRLLSISYAVFCLKKKKK